MMTASLRRLTRFTLAAGMALVLAACSMPLQPQAVPTPALYRLAPFQKIAQLGFGDAAVWAVCTEPACPAVTRKTLAMAPQGLTHFMSARALPPVAATLRNTAAAAPTPQPGRDAIAATPTLAVSFASGSAALSASAKAVLDAAAQHVPPGARLAIAGHTDSTGSRRNNIKLGAARAHAVRDYLAAQLPTQHPVFTLAAHGACCFIASNATASGRRLNRRVEIVFGAAGQAPP